MRGNWIFFVCQDNFFLFIPSLSAVKTNPERQSFLPGTLWEVRLDSIKE